MNNYKKWIFLIHHKGGGEEEGAPLPINPPVHLPFPFPHLKNKAEYVRRLNIDCLKCHVQILYGELGVESSPYPANW